MKASDLFTVSVAFPFREQLPPHANPWEWIPLIKKILSEMDLSIERRNQKPDNVYIAENAYLHPTVRLPHSAVIEGPCWIGPNTEIRPNAYIRGNVIIGANCVLGNSSEFKNCILMDGCQVPHFNYVGDSILGEKAHLGAGVICANLRLDQQNVIVQTPDGRMDSGLRKLGAMLGDAAECGCNVALQPGVILGKRAVVMPTLAFGGLLEHNTIAYEKSVIKKIRRRD